MVVETKNLDVDNTGDVSGMLLYAKTEHHVQPNNVYHMGGNQITVKTLDLNLPFSMITNQLETIVEEHFGVLEERIA